MRYFNFMRFSPLFAKCLIAFLVCILSLTAIYFFGRKMLFDRFIYQKSMAYGYWTKSASSIKDFGKRTKDLVSLISYVYNNPHLTLPENAQAENTLGAATNDTYTIFVIGDSYVFGQGIRTEQRFSNILEKKLNTMRKTKIIVLGGPGDNFFDNYVKYVVAIQKFGIPNLTLIAMVNNDLVFNDPNKYNNKEILTKIIADCQGTEVYDTFADQFNPPSEKGKTAGQLVNDSLSKDTKNLCAFKNLLKYLPKENTLYLSMDSLEWPNTPMQTNLMNNGFGVFYFDGYYKKHKNDYFLDTLFDKDPFSVSKAEPHPSVLANKIFADSVFEEITTNPKRGFR